MRPLDSIHISAAWQQIPSRNSSTCDTTAVDAELAVGNMVRRVLHMVREECQREAELSQGQQQTPFSQAVQAEEEQEDPKGPGLLSKMLRQPGILAVRTVSLHNLLDQPPAASQPLPPSVLVSFLNESAYRTQADVAAGVP
jgi:hypothetical protein